MTILFQNFLVNSFFPHFLNTKFIYVRPYDTFHFKKSLLSVGFSVNIFYCHALKWTNRCVQYNLFFRLSYKFFVICLVISYKLKVISLVLPFPFVILSFPLLPNASCIFICHIYLSLHVLKHFLKLLYS